MISTPTLTGVALLLGLSLFLGLAFEDFFANSKIKRPGGIRTFPLLAAAGGVLYVFDRTYFIPFTAGLVVLGFWLAIFYRQHISEHDEEGEPNVGLVVPILNAHAYILGAIALALPPWVAVAFTVTAVLLLTGREQLHALARRVELKEIVTAGEFLILTGIILPLLPNKPVTDLTTITPRQAWLALVVVCTLSYASYLAQRYWARRRADCGWRRWAAFTPRPRRRSSWRVAKADDAMKGHAQAGITLATAIMYLRILAVVAFFNMSAGVATGPGTVRSFNRRPRDLRRAIPVLQNDDRIPPRRLRRWRAPAAIRWNSVPRRFSPSCSSWCRSYRTGRKREFGASGIYGLAAIVGVTDIDPFVLNLAQGGTAGMPANALAAAILIAASSNNILKAIYAAFFAGGRATAVSAAVLVLLAVAGCAIAAVMGGLIAL